VVKYVGLTDPLDIKGRKSFASYMDAPDSADYSISKSIFAYE